MDKQLIIRVFAIVQALEKCVEASRRMAASSPLKRANTIAALEQQSEVLRNMRRQANRLQLDLAGENWIQAIRSLQIFYGLNQMVRPEIMNTYASLANGAPTKTLPDNHHVCH